MPVIPEECPVCFRSEEEIVWDGPCNSDVPTKCSHWLCTECWMEIRAKARCRHCKYLREVLCPLCREDITEWVYHCVEIKEVDDDDDDDYSDSDEEDEEEA